MKYIVFSFDDGLIDFKNNVVPILNEYGIKATINVISGFSDLSVSTDYEYLSVNDIKELFKDGFEIANHTDSHVKYGSYNELKLCNEKINVWCQVKKTLGIAMPKYAKPNDSSKRFIKEYNPPYVTYETQRVISLKNIFRRLFYKIVSFFKKDELHSVIYSIQRKTYKKGCSKKFNRIEIGRNVNPELLYTSLKTIKSGWCATLCFHSVVDNVDLTSYPKGSCTIAKFKKICELITGDSEFSVVTQICVCAK